MKVDLLVNTITAWDEAPRARHQFTAAAAKKFRVAFVTRNKTGMPGIRTYEGAPNTLVVEPSYPIDYRFRYRLPGINDMYQVWLYSRLKKMFPDATAVNFDCTAIHLKQYFPTIYYCNDEFTGNSKYKSAIVDKYLSRSERKMAGDALFCVATSHFLKEKLKQYNPNIYEIPLGVSLDGVEQSHIEPRTQGDKIVVGLMGVINERQYSPEAVNILLAHDRFKVIIIGPVTPEYLSKLRGLDPSAVKGMLKGKALYDELAKLDVGLALYNLDFVNPGGTPNKVWQYMAVGKPTVISALPNLKYMKFPDHTVYVTQGNHDLIELVERAYAESTPELVRERIAFAQQNTWDHRFEQFLEAFERHAKTTTA
ncbi:MAG TPA: hypothetical protein VIL31_02205 [Cyclobacteriaceae bacterium]|jgi:hypothetical protein